MKKLEELKRQEEEELEKNKPPDSGKKKGKKDKKSKTPDSKKGKKDKKASKTGSEKSSGSKKKGKGKVIDVQPAEKPRPENFVDLKMEYLYQKICLEKRESYYLSQIEDILHPAVLMSDAIYLPQQHAEYLSCAKNFLYGVISHFDEKENDLEVIECIPKQYEERIPVDLILNVVPAHGFLKPFECQVISIGFNPIPKISTSAQLQCHILGGASESINISGVSSEISFSITDTFIEFGRQVTNVFYSSLL